MKMHSTFYFNGGGIFKCAFGEDNSACMENKTVVGIWWLLWDAEEEGI